MKKSVCFMCATLLVLFSTSLCSAQVVPFLSAGSGNEYNPVTAELGGDGITTYMGKTLNFGLAVPFPITDDNDPDFNNPLVLGWTGEATIVAANGDTIEIAGGGKIFLQPLPSGLFTATWNGDFAVQDIDGDGKAGTGRFSNVKAAAEPLAVTAINDPFNIVVSPGDIWCYDFTIAGEIDLGNAGN